MTAAPVAQRIAIVGAGAIGSALLPLLANLNGIGLLIIDGDTVEAANLPRQPLYGPADIGRPKPLAAAERLRHVAPGLEVRAEIRFLDATNAGPLLAECTLVADCTDDLHVRRLIDRTCGASGIPLVTGAVHARQVQVATLHVPRPGDGQRACLRSFFPGRIGAEQDGCDMRDVPAHVTSMAASVMARHITGWLAGDHSLAGVLELIDTTEGRWIRIAAPASPFDDELIATVPAAAGPSMPG